MSETITVGGQTFTIPDQDDSPPWGTGITQALVAIAANIAPGSFMSFVNVASTPTAAVSGKSYLVTTASLAITMNLPTPASNTWFVFKDVSANAAANNITLHRHGGENIDGAAADKTLSRSAGTWLVMCDGTNWWTLNEFPDTGLVNADIASSAAIARSKVAAGTTGQVVINDGSTGALSSEAALAVSRGGTNSGTALNNNRVIKSSGGAIVEAAAITASRALASDANGIPVAATTTTAELNFVSGVTSAIQTQFSNFISSNLKVKVGNFTGSGSIGNQSITGLGFKPRILIFGMGGADASTWLMSVGATDGTGSFVIGGIANDGGTVGGYNTNTSLVIRQVDTSGASVTDISIVSLDADGFTISASVGFSRVVGYIAFQ